MARGWVSAQKLFDVIEDPSYINAVEMDEKKEGCSIEQVNGLIEFRDVWFRYP